MSSINSIGVCTDHAFIRVLLVIQKGTFDLNNFYSPSNIFKKLKFDVIKIFKKIGSIFPLLYGCTEVLTTPSIDGHIMLFPKTL